MDSKTILSKAFPFESQNLLKLKWWVLLLIIYLYLDTYNAIFMKQNSAELFKNFSQMDTHAILSFILITMGFITLSFITFSLSAVLQSNFSDKYRWFKNDPDDGGFDKITIHEFARKTENKHLFKAIDDYDKEQKEGILALRLYYAGILLIMLNYHYNGCISSVSNFSGYSILLYVISVIALFTVTERFITYDGRKIYTLNYYERQEAKQFEKNMNSIGAK